MGNLSALNSEFKTMGNICYRGFYEGVSHGGFIKTEALYSWKDSVVYFLSYSESKYNTSMCIYDMKGGNGKGSGRRCLLWDEAGRGQGREARRKDKYHIFSS